MPSDGSMGQGLGSLGWEQEVLRPQGGWVFFFFFNSYLFGCVP